MERFEEVIWDFFTKLSMNKRRALMERYMQEYICPLCQDHNMSVQTTGDMFYCISGGSLGCIVDLDRCICAQCPVAEKMGLMHEYFCIRVSEAAQRWIWDLMHRI